MKLSDISLFQNNPPWFTNPSQLKGKIWAPYLGQLKRLNCCFMNGGISNYVHIPKYSTATLSIVLGSSSNGRFHNS